LNLWSPRSRDLLATCFMLVSCLAYSSNLKMEAICSVDTQRTTWRYIPVYRRLLQIQCLRISFNDKPCSSKSISTWFEFQRQPSHVVLNEMQFSQRWRFMLWSGGLWHCKHGVIPHKTTMYCSLITILRYEMSQGLMLAWNQTLPNHWPLHYPASAERKYLVKLRRACTNPVVLKVWSADP
jgi:hypothetical protein